MAAELQPPEQLIAGTNTSPSTQPPPPTLEQEQPHHTPSPPQEDPPPKRQRRPSVRLGEIGEQPYDLHVRRTKPSTRHPREWVKAGPTTNIVNGNESDGGIKFDLGKREKGGRGRTKRMRWRWSPKVKGYNNGRVDNMMWQPNSDELENEVVRTWLIELGLSRYAAVFQLHEVDHQVLPLLTLEDLKEMGINSVGSRRKLFSAIQKLPTPFS